MEIPYTFHPSAAAQSVRESTRLIYNANYEQIKDYELLGNCNLVDVVNMRFTAGETQIMTPENELR